MAADTKSCLKGQHTNFYLLSLNQGSGKGGDTVGWRHLRRDWRQKIWERAERVAVGILVLSHSPYGSSHPAQADHFPLSGSSLRGNNSPSPQRDSVPTLWCLSLTAECRVTRLLTEGDSHRRWSLAKVGRSGLETLGERLGMEALGRELRE